MGPNPIPDDGAARRITIFDEFVILEDKSGESERGPVRRRITNWGQSHSPVEGHSTRQISHHLNEIPLA